MREPLQRLYETKLAFLATVFTLLGAGLIVIARLAPQHPSLHWLTSLPVIDLGSALFTTGLVAIVFAYIDGQDSEQRAAQRLRHVLSEQAPAMRDAVINGFAFNPDDVARVATPETLDRIVQNGLAIRLGDQRLAEELYVDIRDQAIRSVERWSDARISIRLSIDRRAIEGSAPGPRTGKPERLVITIRHEYTTTPASQTRRFASVSDNDEYRELAQDGSSTFLWYVNPSGGVDAGSTEAFELVQFSVDGDERPIRRSARKGGQLYTVNLGQPEEERGRPVTLAFTYRLIPPAHNRWLHVDVDQPTRGLDVELDYSDTSIAQVNMLNFIASSQRSIVTKTPPKVPGKSVGLEFDGWMMPRSGVAFVWTMQDDIAQDEAHSAA